MTRGYYTVLTPAAGAPVIEWDWDREGYVMDSRQPLTSVCPHRHYELGGPLAKCLRERGGEAVYVDDQGNRRPLRIDELRELRAHS